PGFVKTPMTEKNTFPMPGLLEADAAAARIVRAVRRGKKVFNFPWHVHLMVKLSRWVPDWAIARVMSGYDEEMHRQDAVARAAEVRDQRPEDRTADRSGSADF